MCSFFSFLTSPEYHGGRKFYMDWNKRKKNLDAWSDSHSGIAKAFGLNEDFCNKYEYNPFTRQFWVDQINSQVSDEIQVQTWLEGFDFSRVIGPLMVKEVDNTRKILTEQDKIKAITLINQFIEKPHICDNYYVLFGKFRDQVMSTVGIPVYNVIVNSLISSLQEKLTKPTHNNLISSAPSWNSVIAYAASMCDTNYSTILDPLVELWDLGVIAYERDEVWTLYPKDRSVPFYTSHQKGIENNGKMVSANARQLETCV